MMSVQQNCFSVHENCSYAQNYFEHSASHHACAEIQKAHDYHFSVPGGRTRERLALDTSTHLYIQDKDAAILASVVEILHNASLIQDDFQDNASQRRGQPTVFSRFGRDVTIGLVNILIAQSFFELSKVQLFDRLPLLIQNTQMAISECVHGQTSELNHRTDYKSFEDRITQATAKSGPLFALAIQLPLIYAGELEYIEDAKQASCQFGLAYQLIDDLKDFKLDEIQSPGTNIFAALANESNERQAIYKMNNTANNCLSNAARICSKFPFGSGKPLLELIERLESQLNAFDV